VQAALGITTLLLQVPIDLGLAHQAMAIIVLGFAAAHWRGTKGSYPIEKETLARA
jgi:cytochrome c oxidase assembly protein subunit 15